MCVLFACVKKKHNTIENKKKNAFLFLFVNNQRTKKANK